MSFCVRRTFAALGYAAKSVFSFIWCEVARKGDVPCGVLLPITSCRLRAQAPNSQIRKRGRGKNLTFLVNSMMSNFLSHELILKSHVYIVRKKHPGNAGTVVDLVELSVYSGAAILAWTACYTAFIQMNGADISALTRAQFQPWLGAVRL